MTDEEEQWRFVRNGSGWIVRGYGYSEQLESFQDCVRFIRKYATAIEKQYRQNHGKRPPAAVR